MKTLSDSEFELFRKHIKQRYGINLTDQKKSLVYSRLRSIIEVRGLKSFKEYYDLLLSDKDGELTKEFVGKITTNHTFFMREKEHFDYLLDKILPIVEKKHNSTKDIRLWCAACSSGEEAYMLQMVLREYFENKSGWNTEILATDISNTVLNKAYRGIYPTDALEVLPETWRRKYFKQHDAHHMEAEKILKENITFAKFNLIEDKFNFKKQFQVIFCRNVMIYFDAETRNNLVNKFYDVSESGAHLFIGQSENLSYTDTKYKYAMPAVYKKL
ncbi:MAG: protein-glutamate O-methyltransferase CheR [Defluviitaleaceae bacterium]|nr:protein-glutamate O-methyltransferase CheR [Defluviitaleaceae bacterium]